MDPLSAILGIGGKLIDKLIPDPAAKADAQLKLLQLAQTGQLEELKADTQLAQGQLDVDKAEASSGNWYNGGWRPTVGYLCCLGLFYALFLQPILTYISAIFKHGAAPTLDTQVLMTLLLGMLGLGGLRSFDKLKGTTT